MLGSRSTHSGPSNQKLNITNVPCMDAPGRADGRLLHEDSTGSAMSQAPVLSHAISRREGLGADGMATFRAHVLAASCVAVGDKVTVPGLSLRAPAKMFATVDSGYALGFSCAKLGGSCWQMHMFHRLQSLPTLCGQAGAATCARWTLSGACSSGELACRERCVTPSSIRALRNTGCSRL